jgi:hypothetical protein
VEDLARVSNVAFELNQLVLTDAFATKHPQGTGRRNNALSNKRPNGRPRREVLGRHSKVSSPLIGKPCKRKSLPTIQILVETANSIATCKYGAAGLKK